MKALMLSHARLLVLPIVMALALVGPGCVQKNDDVSEVCPTGLRTVEDPLSEAPDLSCTDLRGADLKGADLGEADLTGADLTGADLSWANLGEAKMIKANLSGADLRGANLGEINIIRAILTGSGYLDWPNLDDAIYDSTTQLPPDLDPTAIGMTLISE